MIPNGRPAKILLIDSNVYFAKKLGDALSLTFQGSEFMRVRAYAELEKGDAARVNPEWSPGAFLQLEISIGAHGAHPF